MTSRAYKIRKGSEEGGKILDKRGEIKNLAGPATMTSRAYRREGKERARRVRKEKTGKEKAGPATMTSRAYKREREGEM